MNVHLHWEGICWLAAYGSQCSRLGFNLFICMFDVLLGATGLKSFQKVMSSLSKHNCRKIHVCFWKRDVPFTRSSQLWFFVGLWNLGIQLKLLAVAHLAKLTKITFDLLQIQWHFAPLFWKNVQLENNRLIFESHTVSCSKNGCCATSSMHLQEWGSCTFLASLHTFYEMLLT